MKRAICIIISCAIIVCMLSTAAFSVNEMSTDAANTSEKKIYANATMEDAFVDDHIIVVLTNETSLQLREYSAADFSEIDCVAILDLTKAFSEIVACQLSGIEYAPQRNTNGNYAVVADMYTVDTKTFNKILCLTLRNPGKQNVLDAIQILQSRTDILYVGPDYMCTLANTLPNDTYYSLQTMASDSIKLAKAWDYTTGSMSVEVGVLDTGIDASHPDLINRVNVNKSRNFTDVSNITHLEAAEDFHGHGTHVAGIIGAQGNNGQGIAGVCWNVELISLKVAHGAYVESGSLIAAIDYAQQIGIPILNISIAGNTYRPELYQQIENFSGLVVCGAGNEGTDNDSNPYYPASYNCDNIISVGSCSSHGIASTFSNYGKTTVDIFAPGEHIVSCYPIQQCNLGLHDPNTHIADGYHKMSGTSMAAPYVAGVAALILSLYSDITVEEIKARILDYSQPLVQLNNLCVTGGRLNAYMALHPHSFSCVNTNNNSHHDCICSICDYTIQEAHTFVSQFLMMNSENKISATPLYRCSKCGYTTTQLGINSNEWN